MSTKKQLHDHLMANKPEDADHAADCKLCHASNENTPEGGAKNMQTYTAEEVETAVNQAVANLVARVAELESAAQNSEIVAAVNALKAEAEAKIAEVQDALDRAVLEAESAKADFAAYKADLEALEAARVETEEASAREETRMEALLNNTAFSAEYLEANKARFAAMSDEDFETRLAEFAALAPKKETPNEGSGIPNTALTARREGGSTNTDRSLLREVMTDGLLGGKSDLRTL